METNEEVKEKTIEYDKQIECSEKQYCVIVRTLSGIVAHREENGKFYFKLWFMRYQGLVEQILKTA